MNSTETASPKAKLLFVDDEQQLLDGLRQSFRKERSRWEMTFVSAADEALLLAETESFDVVVTDVMMPRMPGAEFLQRLHDANPSTMRLVLSGHADPADMMQALPLIHQWIAKPCRRDELLHILERAVEAHALLTNPVLQRLVGDVTAIPPAPKIHQQLTAALVGGEAPLEEIALLVSADPGLSAKFLQLANSAFFALPRAVDKVVDAVRFLGLQRLSQVVLASEVFQSLPGGDPATLQCVADRALLAARLAPIIAQDLDLDPGAAATAAVLQDAGILLLEHFSPAEADEIRNRSAAGANRCDAELEVLGATHEELGAALLACWGLPLPLLGIVGGHHNDAHLQSNPVQLTGVLQVTNGLIHPHLDRTLMGHMPGIDELEERLTDPTARNRLDHWRRQAVPPGER